MFKPISKVVVVMTMLVAFVGQALAYSTMACEMAGDMHQAHNMHQSTDVSAGHDMMNHSEHSSELTHEMMDHSSMVHDTMSDMQNCCGIDCMCPANACSSTPFISERNLLTPVGISSEALVSKPVAQPSAIPTSLYRPPIFA